MVDVYFLARMLNVRPSVSDYLSTKPSELCAVYIDMGTTNTRAWLMRGDCLAASAKRAMGVRDTAKAGSSIPAHEALRELIAGLRAQHSENPCAPVCVVGSGMIGSSLGLMEVAHLHAPVGIEELSEASRWRHFPDVTDLPVLLVPGIRSGLSGDSAQAVHEIDVMRGEETLCAGLVASGMVTGPAVVLSLGSHWKAIALDQNGRIRSSVTSLSGELIHAVQLQTILSSSVSPERPQHLSADWVEAGMREQRRSGLGRALFCMRLLDLERQGTKEDRLAFIIGAFLGSDLDALLARNVLKTNVPVAVVGTPPVAEVWRLALSRVSIFATVIHAEEAERGLLTGLRRILVACLRSANQSIEARLQ